MTNIDQFESVFKAADKPVFQREGVVLQSVLVVTDLPAAEAAEYARRVRTFLTVLGDNSRWEQLAGADFDGVGQLLQRIGQADPDLICVYRNLHIPATEYPYSLGTYVDVLTQHTELPVLVLPHPKHLQGRDELAPARTVMAITDHLAGDHHLVSFAARLTPPDGRLLLTHVEDENAFERYMTVIGKLPSIDTEEARQEILEQLLKEPAEYIDSCQAVLDSEQAHVEIEKIVTLGHHLNDYKRLVEEHQVDLLVLNTKDEDQLAMHGLAYPLTVELRHTPLLLL